jgi:hypothetical protein
LDGRDVLDQGLIRCIGTGEATDIWIMNWLPRDGLLRPMMSVRANLSQKVSELIDSTTMSRDMQKLGEFFCSHGQGSYC